MTDVRERLSSLHQLEAPDVWDDARRRTPGPSVQPAPLHGGRRAMVVITALAVGIGAVAFVFRAFDGAETRTASYGPPNGWPEVEVAQLGLTFRQPTGWREQPFDEQLGHIGFVGTLVSNTDRTFRHPELPEGSVTNEWDMSELPLDGVAISIERIDGGPTRRTLPPPEDSDFPLSFDDARPVRSGNEGSGSLSPPGPTSQSLLGFVVDGRQVDLRVFVGPEATERDLRAIADIVASIAPSAPSGPMVTVPDLVGLHHQKAFRTLDDTFEWVGAFREIQGVERGRVAATEPAAGAVVEAGSTVTTIVATKVTPLPQGAADALSCEPLERVSFGGPYFRILPAGSAYITGNIGGIRRTDKVVQITFEGELGDGLWHVIRGKAVIAVVDFSTLDGEACAGSGVAGA